MQRCGEHERASGSEKDLHAPLASYVYPTKHLRSAKCTNARIHTCLGALNVVYGRLKK